MKQMIPVFIAFALSFAVGFIAMAVVRKYRKKGLKRTAYVLLSLALSFILCFGVTAVYLNIHYSAEEVAVQVFADSSAPTVTEIDGGWLFDGAGEDTALVFYPGAKVDSEAYAPLMQKIARGGVDCFLLKLPARMAVLDMNAADRVISHYDYDHWILSGHSMGGVAAAGFTAGHSDAVDGLVLLASYPTKPIDNSVCMFSVYGSNDGVLDQSAYENAKQYWPRHSGEMVIDGGNHAQFGNYGKQRGDNDATVSAEEQQQKTAQAVRLCADAVRSEDDSLAIAE